jgi:hypothetical protein
MARSVPAAGDGVMKRFLQLDEKESGQDAWPIAATT